MSKTRKKKSFSKQLEAYADFEWTILFVKAPIDKVINVYEAIEGREFEEAEFVERDKGGCLTHGCLFSVVGSKWVTIIHRISRYDEPDCAELSRQLGTEVLSYCAEDTTGCRSADLYDGDTKTRFQLKEDAATEAELMEEFAELAEEMGQEDATEMITPTIITDYDEHFRSLGIYPIWPFYVDESSIGIHPDEVQFR